ncbi:MAG: HEPN domain-containing protein [Phycisphaerales bacterium]
MPPDRGEASEWLDIARHELAAARHLLAPGALEPGVAAYLAHQSAEKALKGFLTHHEQTFEKTHDLTRLLGLCEAVDPDMSRFRGAAARLTPFVVRFRYPGPFLPTRPEAEAAVLDAEGVVDWIGRVIEAR